MGKWATQEEQAIPGGMGCVGCEDLLGYADYEGIRNPAILPCRVLSELVVDPVGDPIAQLPAVLAWWEVSMRDRAEYKEECLDRGSNHYSVAKRVDSEIDRFVH